MRGTALAPASTTSSAPLAPAPLAPFSGGGPAGGRRPLLVVVGPSVRRPRPVAVRPCARRFWPVSCPWPLSPLAKKYHGVDTYPKRQPGEVRVIYRVHADTEVMQSNAD